MTRPFIELDNAPKPKKNISPIKKDKKLGLIKRDATKKRAYRFRVETIEALTELTNKINAKSNIKLSMTNIIELLILDAAKNPKKVFELIEG